MNTIVASMECRTFLTSLVLYYPSMILEWILSTHPAYSINRVRMISFFIHLIQRVADRQRYRTVEIFESDRISQIIGDDSFSLPCIQPNLSMDGIHDKSSQRHVANAGLFARSR